MTGIRRVRLEQILVVDNIHLALAVARDSIVFCPNIMERFLIEVPGQWRGRDIKLLYFCGLNAACLGDGRVNYQAIPVEGGVEMSLVLRDSSAGVVSEIRYFHEIR